MPVPQGVGHRLRLTAAFAVATIAKTAAAAEAAASAAPVTAVPSRSAGKGVARRARLGRARMRHGRWDSATSTRRIAARNAHGRSQPLSASERLIAEAADAVRSAFDAACDARAAHMRSMDNPGALDVITADHAAIRILAAAQANLRLRIALLYPLRRVAATGPDDAMAGAGSPAVPAVPSPATSKRKVRELGLAGRLLREQGRAWRRRVAGHVKLHHTSSAAASARETDIHVLTTLDVRGWRRISPHSVTITNLGQLALRYARAARRQGTVLMAGDDHFCTLPCSVCGHSPPTGTRGAVKHINCFNCGADLPRDLASTTNEARRNVVFADEAFNALLLRATPQGVVEDGAAGAAAL